MWVPVWEQRRTNEEVEIEYRIAQRRLRELIQGGQEPQVIDRHREIPRWGKEQHIWVHPEGGIVAGLEDGIPAPDINLRQIQFVISQGSEEFGEEYLLSLAREDIYYFKVLRPHLSWYPFEDPHQDTRGDPFLDNLFWSICNYTQRGAVGSTETESQPFVGGAGPIDFSAHEYYNWQNQREVIREWKIRWQTYSVAPDPDNVFYPTLARGNAPERRCFEDSLLIHIVRHEGHTQFDDFNWFGTVYEVGILVRYRTLRLTRIRESDHPRPNRWRDPQHPHLPTGYRPRSVSGPRNARYERRNYDTDRYNFIKSFWLDHLGNLITTNDPGVTQITETTR